MPTGAITGYIDVAQVVLYVFWGFFALLILYLHRENKREGYPLESERSRHIRVEGFPPTPPVKYFRLATGGVASSSRVDTREIKARPAEPWPGAPLEPTGNPMLDGVGPASYASRADAPELTSEGHPLIVPMRIAGEASIDPRDPDPRGMQVIGGDGKVAGTVSELWVDLSEPQIRYLEVTVDGAGRTALLPITFARIRRQRRVIEVSSIFARHFADVPAIKSSEQITKLEEDMITAYYAGGTLYASPDRLGPIL